VLFTVADVAAAAACEACTTAAVLAVAFTAACVVDVTPSPSWPNVTEAVNVAIANASVF